MNGKVTGLDRVLAANIKRFRVASKLTQPEVAEYLGFTYQHYQKMEAGQVSFRVSILDRLASLYNLTLSQIANGAETQDPDPAVVRAIWLMRDFSADDREAVIRAILTIKASK